MPCASNVARVAASAEVPQHPGAKAEFKRVLRRPQHAYVTRQAAHNNLIHVALAQPAGQPGTGALAIRAVVFAKAAIGIHAGIATLAYHRIQCRPVDVWMQLGAGRALHAMLRPQRLWLTV